jgi:hypothetical protein
MTERRQPPRGLGGLRDLRDDRDWPAHPLLQAEQRLQAVEIPSYKSLYAQMPKVYDQGHLGSCTANGICALYEHGLKVQGIRTATPSRLEVYRDARILLDPAYADVDSGATGRTAIKAIAAGACPEKLWEYDDGQNKFKLPPRQECLDAAPAHQALNYYRLDESDPRTLEQEITLNVTLGYPVGFGIVLYDSYEPDHVTGRIPTPNPVSDREWGGHYQVIIGFDYRQGRRDLLVRNSWGEGWGGMERRILGIPVGRKLKGHALVPMDWLVAEAWDCWTIRTVEG